MPNPTITPLMSKKVTNHTSIIPLDAIRTETVLSRLPIHNLAKRGRVNIRITRRNEHGAVDLNWEVIPNLTIGEPRALAYKLDTIVINRRIDEAPRPIPELIYLGSLRDIARELNLGNDTPAVKKALSQNAALTLTVKIQYIDKDGMQQVAEFTDTRYGVIFTGQKLPNGSKAAGVYLMLHAPYRQVLNNAPVRPLDYSYLKALSPAAQRFYEIVSYKMFAALKYKHPHASLSYSEYCMLSAQQRYDNYKQAKKQMYKVHYPHLQSGYLRKITYEETVTSDGEKDWIFQYVPGPKAQAEFKAFNGKHSTIADTLDQELELTLEASEASAPDEAQELVQYFHRRFHQNNTPTPTAKELAFAVALIEQYGMEQSRAMVDYSREAAATTKYEPRMLIGIRQYVEPAIKTLGAQAKQRETIRREEATARQEAQLSAQYEHHRDQAIDRMKSTMAPADLAAMESSIRTDLRAKGSVYHASEMMIRIELDRQLASRAGVLPYEEWRAQHTKA